ncbi:MAG: HAD family hydrolase [Succinivibrionaceae bacterium]|nr:HAD family hydrolase [Succinivibrionaceae bacterium]
MGSRRRAVFLDRDGVLNVDRGYVGEIGRFELYPEAAPALAALRRAGFLLILCTNQSGIARGRFGLGDFWRLSAHMQRLLARDHAELDAIYLCPHHPEAEVPEFKQDCPCRKPRPGMFLKALGDFGLDPRDCLAIGDRIRDLEAAKNAGICQGLLVRPSVPAELGAFPGQLAFGGLLEAAAAILEGDIASWDQA